MREEESDEELQKSVGALFAADRTSVENRMIGKQKRVPSFPSRPRQRERQHSPQQ
ncbi:hypothetical protein SBF1_2870005 [Candidatus Desulfosporosinus infrequens]|uniref:Uncharacterized protein n=1 Tax=Candidatus Desulfosporosinus infrequens TaxID=2043169 RepID=A0A2U3KUZ2_9FIRM|nr:hypothetical protein SBF1_2870005 [Candidatus Desulfosporosinus infrequens]